MEYQLMKGDSLIVLCKKCKKISFDHKVCMHCNYEFTETDRVKLLKGNKEVIEVTGWNIKPMPSQTLEVKEDILCQPIIQEKQQELKSRDEQQKARSKPDKKRNTFYNLVRSVGDRDILTLEEGAYLNDTIIDVYLEYIYHKQILPDVQTRTHIFSTHFFSTLRLKWQEAEKKPEVMFEIQKQWVSTNIWTRNVNLFSKDFIFIPIHTGSHWYLSVLCHLPEFLKGDFSYERKQSCELPKAGSTKKLPCLYFFDSLDNVNSICEEKLISAKYIIEFFKTLWNNKNPDASYDWRNIFIRKTTCPQQTNGYDCGIYLLQYVENFFKISISMSLDLSNWFSEQEMKNKRTEIKSIIKKLQKNVPYTSHYSSDSSVTG